MVKQFNGTDRVTPARYSVLWLTARTYIFLYTVVQIEGFYYLTGLLYIVGRRPFLAWLLALDSPSIHFSRAFDYRAPHDIPRGAHPERLNQRPPVLCRLIVVVQYVAAIGSVVNVWLQAWELGIQTFCTVAPNFFLAPALWTVLRVFLHLLSMILVRLRIRRNCGGVEAGEVMGWRRWLKTVLPRCMGYRVPPLRDAERRECRQIQGGHVVRRRRLVPPHPLRRTHPFLHPRLLELRLYRYQRCCRRPQPPHGVSHLASNPCPDSSGPTTVVSYVDGRKGVDQPPRPSGESSGGGDDSSPMGMPLTTWGEQLVSQLSITRY